MKNAKTYLAILLATALLLSLALFSASCTSPENGGSETTTPEEGSTTPKDDESTTPKEEDSDPSADDDKITYTVTVKDENGAPIEGVRLQVCSKTTGVCFVPLLFTDENGVATTSREEDAYEISIVVAEGYVFDKNVKYGFEDGETELTITLTAQATE